MNSKLKKLAQRLSATLTVVAAAALWSCESIYEYEGDCDPHWQVKFIYDMNMNFADAFPGSMGVGSVHLYVFDAETHRLVLEKEQTAGAEGFAENYTMPVEELPAGRYDFVAWCGLADNRSFVGAQAAAGRALSLRGPESLVGAELPMQAPELFDKSALAWRISDAVFAAPNADDTRRLDPLYYGRAENIEVDDKQGVHIVPVHLIKDTNEFTILLQHRSGPLNPEDFEIKIVDDNSGLRWDNLLWRGETPEGEPLADYLPWWQKSGTVQTTPEIETVPGMQPEFLVVRLSTSRLVKREMTGGGPRLVITNVKENRVVYEIALQDYLLLPEEHTHLRDAHNKVHEVSDQEYLDRVDNWSMQFILGDKDDSWYAMDLHILGWHVIRMSTDLGAK